MAGVKKQMSSPQACKSLKLLPPRNKTPCVVQRSKVTNRTSENLGSKYDELADIYSTVSKDHQQLQDKYNAVCVDLESSHQMLKNLSEQLNKDTRSHETQTCGISIEQLEKSLSDMLSENASLSLELNNTKKIVANMKFDVSAKCDQLTTMSEKNSSLNSKIENLNKTIKEKVEQNSEKILLIDELRTQKNTFKKDLFEAQKQRDDYYESYMLFKNKYEKASAKLQKVNLEAEKYRKAEVVKSMVSSELIDENQKLKDDNEKKGDKIAGMREVIAKHQELIEAYKQVDNEQIITIGSLKDEISQLKKDISTIEQRAECWINENVRDTFESKISYLETEVEQLKTDNKRLSEEKKQFSIENSELITKKDNIIKINKTRIDQQTKLLGLMRNVRHDSEAVNSRFQTTFMNSVFMKFEDEQKLKNSLEELTEANYRLQEQNNEFMRVFQSHPYNELFRSYK